jgi:TnpA family transposase
MPMAAASPITSSAFWLALLGFRFAPRIPNLRDRRLYALPGVTLIETIEA